MRARTVALTLIAMLPALGYTLAMRLVSYSPDRHTVREVR